MKNSDVELWLKRNAFQCPIGRVSIDTCRSLRRRPVFDPAHPSPWLAINLNGDESSPKLYRPTQCIDCQEWKKHDPDCVEISDEKPAGKGRTCKVEGCNDPAVTRGMCKRHYARWYYRKNKKAGKEVREMETKSERICQDCGTSFTPWVNGKITVTNVCPDCVAKRHKEGMEKKKRVLQIDLSDRLEAFKALQEAAKKNIRTVEHQALYYVLTGLKEEEGN